MCLWMNVLFFITTLFCLVTSARDLTYDQRYMRNMLCPGCTRNTENCNELPDQVLEEILGPAFNARYMSITEPNPTEESNKNGKRKTDHNLDFYVDSQYYEEVADQPAWTITNHVEIQMQQFGIQRYKRATDYKQEWQCESKLKWIDLGPDYFPRYLRSVECITDTCWFNMYKCKPRSFTVKILRKKRDKCVIAEPGTRIGVAGLPKELRELWVWEERAVSFCCDCTLFN